VQEDSYTDCAFQESCAVRQVWERITDATRSILRDTTFAALLTQEREGAGTAAR